MSVFVTFLEMMAWVVFPSLAGGSLAALATPSGGRGLADLLRGTLSRLSERVRLRLAAASLDLGCHLMLCEEERRARRLARRLSGLRALRSGLKTAALRAGARRKDEVTLEVLIGSRDQECNPGRTLELSLLVHHPPQEEGEPRPADGESGEPCRLAWRVLNRPSDGCRGVSVSVEIPSMERALLSYHARPLPPPERGGRFFDEGVFE